MLKTFPFYQYYLISIWVIYFFETYLKYRQYQTFLGKERPKEIVHLVDQDTFIVSQNYQLDKSLFGFAIDSFEQIKTFLVWYFFVIPWLWNRCGDITVNFGYREYDAIQTCIFLAIIFIVEDLISLPFSLYNTFVIEEIHGFNKQTLKLYFIDKAKLYGLMLIIGLPLVVLFLQIIKWGGEFLYIYVPIFLFAVQMIALTIYPVLIQPCFNKVIPLPKGPLRTAIEELASNESIQFPLTELYKIDGSKRSAHSNAYLYGFCKNKRIVLFDTLIEQNTQAEIVAVLGHELGHWKLNHTIWLFVFSQIQNCIIFFLFSQMIHNDNLYRSFGFNTKPILIGFMLFIIILSPFNQVISFLMTAIIRRFEFQADNFSVKLGYGPLLKNSLVKLQKENLGAMNPDWLYSMFYYSHPRMVERLQRINKELNF